MKLWLAVLAVTVANWLLKASGPLVLGRRRLPRAARNVVGLVAPVLLAGLIVIELAGPGWDGLDWRQIAGVAAAGLSRVMLRLPMLAAVLLGAAVTAGLRLL